MHKPTVLIVILLTATAGCHFHLDFLGKESMEEVTLIPSRAPHKILLLDISGVIGVIGHPGLFPSRDGNILSRVFYRLEQAAADPQVKGIILRLDTPGGEVTASDILYNEILQFRAKTGIPVVALMMGLSTSGGYYIASACDFILAHPSTITGSIGVISIFPNIEELFDKVGVKMTVIKSGQMKDSGSPFRGMSEEETAVFQEIVDGFHDNFVRAVISVRGDKLSEAKLRSLADGRIYTAPQALDAGLIDAVGYFSDALGKTLELAGVAEAGVVAYSYYPRSATNIYATRLEGSGSWQGRGLEQLLQTLKSGFYYLWIPQLRE
jgi:protease-4